jgi:Kef-type K+ transport system membrane component KefB
MEAGETAAGAAAHTAAGGHGAEVATVLLGVIVILVVAKLVGHLFVRLGQPVVLGELTGGILLGNLGLAGIDGLGWIATDPVINVLAEIGVILLLFEVGLESTVRDMLAVGRDAFLVATLGVVAPFLLGFGAGVALLPDESVYVHLFLGATLCATSVGLTARVLQDIGKSTSREAKIILGAAVIDDVMGLVILATVVGIITAADGGGGLSIGSVAWIIAKSGLFLGLSLAIGTWLSPRLFRAASHLKADGTLLATALVVCFALAWLAWWVGLAPIVGAFAAGLILEPAHFRDFQVRRERPLEELIRPIGLLLVPIFFVRMGAQVDVRALGDGSIVGFAAALTVLAIVGKQVCALGVTSSGVNRLAVGIGMIPRGEVGLIFAAIGAGLTDPAGHRIVAPATYGAVVLMVIATTMVTPPLLKWAMRSTREP